MEELVQLSAISQNIPPSPFDYETISQSREKSFKYLRDYKIARILIRFKA